MDKKVAQLIVKSNPQEFKLIPKYKGKGCYSTTYAVAVPSLNILIQALIEHSENFNDIKEVNYIRSDSLGMNFIIY